jgi:hypothetical protein
MFPLDRPRIQLVKIRVPPALPWCAEESGWTENTNGLCLE